MKVEDHILIGCYKHVLCKRDFISQEEPLSKSAKFYEWLNTRRSVREYSNQPVPKVVIENIIKSASTYNF